MKLFTLYHKETLRPLGFVADFCPIERRVTAGRVDAIHESRYLSFLRLDDGPVVRHDRTCCSCGLVAPTERHCYASFEVDPSTPLEALEQRTNPRVSARYADLVRLREEIEQGHSVDEELRAALVREQFALLDQIAAQHWRGETKLDRTSLLFGLSSLVLFFAALCAIPPLVPEARRLDAVGTIFAAGLGLMAINALVFFRAPHRAIKKHTLPLVAAALRPLRLSPLELTALWREMRAEGFTYATKMKPGDVLSLDRGPEA